MSKVFSPAVLMKPKSWTVLVRQGVPFEFFIFRVANRQQKVEQVPFDEIFLKGGPFGMFYHPFCRKNSKQIERGPNGGALFSKQSHNANKNLVLVR